MSLTLDPLADEDDRWLMAIDRLAAKLRNPDLSFHKYLVANGFEAPNVFEHRGVNFGDQLWDPPLDLCPAVVILATPSSPPQDRGAGDERWYFNVLVNFKIWVKDSDQKKALRAYHELIRTIFAGWRPGTLDPLSTIPGVGYHAITSDLSVVLLTAQSGGQVGRASFVLQFSIHERILG